MNASYDGVIERTDVEETRQQQGQSPELAAHSATEKSRVNSHTIRPGRLQDWTSVVAKSNHGFQESSIGESKTDQTTKTRKYSPKILPKILPLPLQAPGKANIQSIDTSYLDPLLAPGVDLVLPHPSQDSVVLQPQQISERQGSIPHAKVCAEYQPSLVSGGRVDLTKIPGFTATDRGTFSFGGKEAMQINANERNSKADDKVS